MEQYIPQTIYLVLSISGLFLSINNHGKPRTPENAWNTLFATLIGLTLLVLGGFFN